MSKKEQQQPTVRVGYLMIDAWREEAIWFERDGKIQAAARLRRMANRAEAALERWKTYERNEP